MPPAAELVYPEPEEDVDTDKATSEKEGKEGKKEKKERFANSKRRVKNLQDYKDRRARAKYIGEYGQDSSLATPGAADPSNFVSKYSDPNHPVHHERPSEMYKGRNGPQTYRLAKPSDQQRTEAKSGPFARARGKFQESILYLMITELPSEEEGK